MAEPKSDPGPDAAGHDILDPSDVSSTFRHRMLEELVRLMPSEEAQQEAAGESSEESDPPATDSSRMNELLRRRIDNWTATTFEAVRAGMRLLSEVNAAAAAGPPPPEDDAGRLHEMVRQPAGMRRSLSDDDWNDALAFTAELHRRAEQLGVSVDDILQGTLEAADASEQTAEESRSGLSGQSTLAPPSEDAPPSDHLTPRLLEQAMRSMPARLHADDGRNIIGYAVPATAAGESATLRFPADQARPYQLVRPSYPNPSAPVSAYGLIPHDPDYIAEV